MTPAGLWPSARWAWFGGVNAASSIAQGFLLGLSSGVTCLASCAPVLLPLLVGVRGGARRQGVLVGEYLAGRLAGYLCFGVLAWFGAQWVPGDLTGSPALKGGLYLSMGVLMLVHGVCVFRKAGGAPAPRPEARHAGCAVSPWRVRTWLARWPAAIPAALGLLSGLNVCPPFVVALAQGSLAGNLAGVLLFFLSFFLATALFFVPLPLLGALSRRTGAMWVAAFAGSFVGLFFLYSGSLHLLAACHHG